MLIPVWSNLFFLLLLILGMIFILHVCFPRSLKKAKSIFFKGWKSINGNSLILGCASCCAFLFLLAAFFAPNILAPFPLGHYLSSNIATSINGLMSPFIAIAAAILTFMAFWVQYNANQKIFNENKRQQIERQFYEMLKIHKDNVKSFHAKNDTTSITGNGISRGITYEAHGQDYISAVLAEFNSVYEIVKRLMPNTDFFSISYDIFYFGYEHACKHKDLSPECQLELEECMDSAIFHEFPFTKLNIFGQSLFKGHLAQFNSYYRHLFLTVKTIVSVDDDILNYSEKRQFLRILRAQLTSAEQVLLFYNWKSGCGGAWEGETESGKKNHFFTDYRMIHNINPSDCEAFHESELLKELMDINPDFKYEGESREKDPLFELIR